MTEVVVMKWCVAVDNASSGGGVNDTGGCDGTINDLENVILISIILVVFVERFCVLLVVSE